MGKSRAVALPRAVMVANLTEADSLTQEGGNSTTPLQQLTTDGFPANPSSRENSLKHAAYEVFRKGLPRAEFVAAIMALGAAKSTAQTWHTGFRALVRKAREQ